MDIDELAAAAALRLRLPLEPIDGPGGRIFPPTYPAPDGARAPDDGPRHVVETYATASGPRRRVMLDSVASQANRQEAALVAARRQGRVAFPDLTVDLSGTVAGIDELLVSELPHRLADAIVRDCCVGNADFAEAALGRAVLGATPSDLTAILEASPTTLVFGAWFSQWGAARPLKLQRLAVGEIWADGAELGLAVGSRIDPLGIGVLDIYAAEDRGWTAREDEAARDGKGQPRRHSKKRRSELNHGNVRPEIHAQGITAERIEARWSFSTAALRRLRFGGTPEERAVRDQAGQRYVLALALAARALAHQEGYALRSRCDLLPAGPFALEVLRIGAQGLEAEPHILDVAAATALLEEATEAAREAGFTLECEDGPARRLVPAKRLEGLIARNKEVAAARDEEAQPT